MQSPVIMAFRKRMKKRGYYDISIFKDKISEIYLVSAVEPLANSRVKAPLSLIDMHNMFRF